MYSADKFMFRPVASDPRHSNKKRPSSLSIHSPSICRSIAIHPQMRLDQDRLIRDSLFPLLLALLSASALRLLPLAVS